MTEEEHRLADVIKRTHERIGWKPAPGGVGKVPDIKLLEQPYWRWYCSCGTVGGKRSSKSAAVADHNQHATEMKGLL